MHPVMSSSPRYRMAQIAPERPSPPSLPLTVIERIGAFAYGPTDLGGHFSLKEVSKNFRDLDITPISRRQWERLLASPQSGIIDIPSEMRDIERAFVRNPRDSSDRYIQLFKRLMRVFYSLGVSMERGDMLKTTLADYAGLQSILLDHQLQLCWPQMKRAIAEKLGCSSCFYRAPPDDADPKTIRAFLQKGGIKKAILSVKYLEFTNPSLVSLPIEVTFFTNITALYLKSWRFISLPASSFLVRSRSPSMPFVFDQRPAFPHLESLFITSSVRDPAFRRRGVRAIPSLRSFPNLKHIEFNIPTLTSLSSARGILSDELTISLLGSRVYDYMMDKDYRPYASNEILYNTISHLRSYQPRSPLALLYHKMLYTDATMAQLQEVVDLLPIQDRNLLYYSIWKHTPASPNEEEDTIGWGREHCFENEHIFRKAIGQSIQEKFRQIESRRDHSFLALVYRNLGDLFNPQLRAEPFFETLVTSQRFDNFPRLADAMSTILVNKIADLDFENYWERF